MEAEVFKVVAPVAGLGGIALGVVLFLFRDIIRRNIFPRLLQRDAFRIILAIIAAVWSLAVIAIFSGFMADTKSQEPKVVDLRQLNPGGTPDPNQDSDVAPGVRFDDPTDCGDGREVAPSSGHSIVCITPDELQRREMEAASQLEPSAGSGSAPE